MVADLSGSYETFRASMNSVGERYRAGQLKAQLDPSVETPLSDGQEPWRDEGSREGQLKTQQGQQNEMQTHHTDSQDPGRDEGEVVGQLKAEEDTLWHHHCSEDGDLHEVDGSHTIVKVKARRQDTPAEFPDGPYPPGLCSVEQEQDPDEVVGSLYVLDPLEPDLDEALEFHKLGIDIVTQKYHSEILDKYLYRHYVVHIEPFGEQLQLQVNDEVIMANSKSVVDEDQLALMSTISQLQQVPNHLFTLSLVVRRCIHPWGEPCTRPIQGATHSPGEKYCQYLHISALIEFNPNLEADISRVTFHNVHQESLKPDTIRRINKKGSKKCNVKLSNTPDYVWKVNCAGVDVTSAQHERKEFEFTVQSYEVECVDFTRNKDAVEIIFADEMHNLRHLVVKEDNTVRSQALSEMKKQSGISWPEIQPALWVNGGSCSDIKLEALTKPGFYLLTRTKETVTSASTNGVGRLSAAACLVGSEEYPCPSLYLQKSKHDLVPDGGRYRLLPVRQPSLLRRQPAFERSLSSTPGEQHLITHLVPSLSSENISNPKSPARPKNSQLETTFCFTRDPEGTCQSPSADHPPSNNPPSTPEIQHQKHKSSFLWCCLKKQAD